MSYESRIYVVDVRRRAGYTFPCRIAMMEMGAMPYHSGWKELFKTPIDYTLYEINGLDEETQEDCYGEHIKSAKLEDVITWLENRIQTEEYRRFRPALGLLKGFDPDDWDCLEVLHYGH